MPQKHDKAPDTSDLLNRIQPIGTDMHYSWEEPDGERPAQKGWRKHLPVILVSVGALAVLTMVVLFLVLSGKPPAPADGSSAPAEETLSDTSSQPDTTRFPDPDTSLDKVGTLFFNKLSVFREIREDGTRLLGVCDTQNRILIEPQYDTISFLNLERLLVSKGEAMGVVDLENQAIYPLAEQSIKYSKSANGQSQPLLIVVKEKESLLIDLNGGQVGESWDSIRFTIYDTIEAERSGEKVTLNWQGLPSSALPSGAKLEAAQDGESYIFRINDLYGIADLDRQVLVPAIYDYLDECIPGRFYVRHAAGEGIIDRQGAEIIPVSQDEIDYHHNGENDDVRKAVIVRKGPRYRLMSVETGRLLHPEDWDYISWDYYVSRWNNEAVYAVKGSREVFLHVRGEELSQKPGDPFPSGEGFLTYSRPDLQEMMRIVQGQHFFGLWDGDGNQLIPADYLSLERVRDDRILAEQEIGGKSRYLLLDFQGAQVSDRIYEEVYYGSPQDFEREDIGVAGYTENDRVRYVIVNQDFEPVSGPYDRIDRDYDVFQCWLDGACRTVTANSLGYGD